MDEVDSHFLNGEDLSRFPGNGEKIFGQQKTALRRVLLSVKTLRRILNFKERIFKYGVFVPRGDKEADASPDNV